MLRLSHVAIGGGAAVGTVRCTRSGRASGRLFLGIVALLLAASATATILGCAAMDARAQPMPGGWMLSAMWTPLCGQGGPGTVPACAGMWSAMMVAMMLPSLAPALWRYRSMLERTATSALANRRAAIVAMGYFAVWIALGLVLFALGAAAGELLLQSPAWSRAMPAFAGAVVTGAGVLQFAAWKRRHLACCRAALRGGDHAAGTSGAWRKGVRLGLRCSAACANLTAVLLALGAMDLRAMAFVTAAITAERLAPRAAYVVQGIGIVLVATGACMVGQVAA